MVLLSIAAGPAFAQIDLSRKAPFEITAQSIEFQKSRDLYVAEGDVRIVQLGRSLEADWLAFNNRTRRGVASGHVVIRDAEDLIRADFFQFDLDTLEGVAFSGEFDLGEPAFRISFEEFLKISDDRYRVKHGTFTTCRCPEEGRDPWRFRSSDAQVHIGGYGTSRNSTMDILGVPVFWIPWMFFPVKTERQSGLLLPDFSFGSRNGFEVGLPLFWAARDNLNVTLTPRYLTKRGLKPDLDFEYVFGRRSEGSLFLSALRDRDVVSIDEFEKDFAADPGTSTVPDPFDDERWAAHWEHDQVLPGNGRLRADVRLVSDNRYPSDFAELSENRRDRFLESKIFGFANAGSDGRFGGMAALLVADDLQNPDDTDRDQFLLQRVPWLALDALSTPHQSWLGLVTSLEVDYIHWRPQRSPEDVLHVDQVVGDDLFIDTGIDGLPNSGEGSIVFRAKNPGNTSDIHGDDFATAGGPEGDGLFQEGEPLADRGHRIMLQPSLARPVRLADAVELYPEVGYQEMLYFTSAQDFEERGLLTSRVELRSQIDGRWDAPGLPPLRHRLEPRVGWARVSHRSQSGNPLFVPKTAVPQRRIRQLDLDNVVRDPADRISDANLVTLGFGNRFYSGAGSGRGETLRADFVISGEYDFESEEFGQLVIDGSSYAASGITARFNFAFDPERKRPDEGLFDVHVPLPKGKPPWPTGGSLGVRYRYLRDIPRFFEDFQSDPDRFGEFEEGFNHVHQIDPRVRVALGQSWSLKYRASYSFQDELLLGQGGSIAYISKCQCWGFQLEVWDGRNRGLQFGLRFTLLGLGNDSGNPFSGTSIGTATGLP